MPVVKKIITQKTIGLLNVYLLENRRFRGYFCIEIIVFVFGIAKKKNIIGDAEKIIFLMEVPHQPLILVLIALINLIVLCIFIHFIVLLQIMSSSGDELSEEERGGKSNVLMSLLLVHFH